MSYILKIFQRKFDVMIIFGLTILPVFLHLNKKNLINYSLNDIIYLFIFQFFLSILIFFITLLMSICLKKKFFSELLICNFVLFFLQFYYLEIKSSELIALAHHLFYLLDNITILLIFAIPYFIIFIFLKNYKKGTIKFLSYFILINLLISIYPTLRHINLDQNQNIDLSDNNAINLKDIKEINENELADVYFIISDEIISLEKAKELEIINSKSEFEQRFKNIDFKYKSDFIPNYSQTIYSVTTSLKGNYPVTEKTKKYQNFDKFFPSIMYDLNNDFYKILEKLNQNFFWIGNNIVPCDIKRLKDKCNFNYKKKNQILNYLHIVNAQYLMKNSFMLYMFEKYFLLKSDGSEWKGYRYKNFITAYDFLKNTKTPEQKELLRNRSNFFLIHIMKPHVPYNLNKDCKNIDNKKGEFDEMKYYSYAYNCVLNLLIDWVGNFPNKKKKNIILIFGDHGKDFKNADTYDEKLKDIFFAYKVPKNCENIEPPKSHVNLMRFVLKCLNNQKIKYLPNKQYLTYSENDKKFGKVQLFRQKN